MGSGYESLKRFLDMQAALGPEVHVFLSDIETDVWEKGTVGRLSEQSGRWLITRGEKGAQEVNRQRSTHLPPHKVEYHNSPLFTLHDFTISPTSINGSCNCICIGQAMLFQVGLI